MGITGNGSVRKTSPESDLKVCAAIAELKARG